MNEEKKLLQMQLYLQYYKKDITDRYHIMLDNIVLDNDVLNNIRERLWITTYDKYIKMEQENQKLKEQLEHYKVQEIERINKDLLQARNDYLERHIKANMSKYFEVREDGFVTIKNIREQLNPLGREVFDCLQQENQQLKQSLNEQMKETNKENLDCSKYVAENNNLKEQRDLYKSVIDEIKKCINKKQIYFSITDCSGVEVCKEVLQIIDKVLGDDEK